jgi:hypothetical protein
MSTPSTIRAAVAERYEGFQGLRESREPYEFVRANGRSPVHLEYAIGIPGSEPLTDRQRADVGVLTKSTLVITFHYQLPPKDRIVGFDAFLELERDVRDRMMEQSPSWPVAFSVIWASSNRTAAAQDGWLISEQSFNVVHLLPLS